MSFDGLDPVAVAHADPLRVLRDGVVAEAALGGDAASRVARARGLASLAVRDATAARDHLERAVALAVRPERRHEASISLAAVDATEGDFEAAVARLDDVRTTAPRPLALQAMVQLAAVQFRRGIPLEALRLLDEAEPELEARGGREWLAHAQLTRALLAGDRGEHGEALAALERALDHVESQGQTARSSLILHTLGWVTALRGDVPHALGHLDRARGIRTTLGLPIANLLLERSSVLRHAGMLDEAAQNAAAAVAELERRDAPSVLADAVAELAEVLLDAGRANEARETAARAQVLLADQGRPEAAAVARHVELRAAMVADGPSVGLLADARSVIAALERSGRSQHAGDARLLAAEVAIALGRHEEARAALADVDLQATERPVRQRVRARHALALLRVAEGDEAAARHAVDEGLAMLSAYRSALGGLELRAHAGTHVAALVDLGVSLAAEAGDDAGLLALVDRVRSDYWVGVSTAAGSADPDALAALRLVVAEQWSGAASDPVGAERRQRDLEERIRAQAAATSSRSLPTSTPVRTATGTTEVALIELHGELVGLVRRGGEVRRFDLGPASDIADELGALRFAMRRLASSPEGDSALAVARRRAAALAFDVAASTLDRLLVAPLGLGATAVAISPTGPLHAVPWAVLPSLSGVAVTVTPAFSANLPTCPRSNGTVVVAGGPRLEHVSAELDAVAHTHGAAAMRLDAPTGQQVLAAIDGVAVAHLACHGHFRSDNAEFSSLEFADGPLFVHDLAGLGHAPDLVVLSACDAGLSSVHAGDALLGMATAFLRAGTRHLISAVLPVPDEVARDLSSALHRHLAAGLQPAAALAAAQLEMAQRGEPHRWARAFICTGTPG